MPCKNSVTVPSNAPEDHNNNEVGFFLDGAGCGRGFVGRVAEGCVEAGLIGWPVSPGDARGSGAVCLMLDGGDEVRLNRTPGRPVAVGATRGTTRLDR
jgi:hypothetical protein